MIGNERWVPGPTVLGCQFLCIVARCAQLGREKRELKRGRGADVSIRWVSSPGISSVVQRWINMSAGHDRCTVVSLARLVISGNRRELTARESQMMDARKANMAGKGAASWS
jgi:hypothetical protein